MNPKLAMGRQLVRRMWDVGFVCGVGQLVLAATLTETQPTVAAIVAYTAGMFITSWIDRFTFDGMNAIMKNMAELLAQQQDLIGRLRARLIELDGPDTIP